MLRSSNPPTTRLINEPPDPIIKAQVATLEKTVAELKRYVEYIKREIKDINENTNKTQRD